MFFVRLCHFIPTPPHSRTLRCSLLRFLAEFSSFSNTRDHHHALKGPADGKPECTLRLKIIKTPRIFEKLVDRRPDLEPPDVRRQRGGETAQSGALVSQAWIANLAGLDEIRGRQKLRVQTVGVVWVVGADGRLNGWQHYDQLDIRQSPTTKNTS